MNIDDEFVEEPMASGNDDDALNIVSPPTHEDDRIIENAAAAWNEGDTPNLPSPSELESASARIESRTGWVRVTLKEDAQGNKTLTAGDLEDMLSQSRRTRTTETMIDSDREAIWNAVRGIYDEKPL